MTQPTIEANMTKSLVSVRWSHPMAKAWGIMREKRVRHLPVIGDSGELVGILSDRDVKRAMDPEFPAFDLDCTVSDYMAWPVLTVDHHDTLREVLDTMISRKVSALVVTRNGAVVGITTSEDMLRLLRDLLQKGAKEEKLSLLDVQLSPYLQEAIREASSVGI